MRPSSRVHAWLTLSALAFAPACPGDDPTQADGTGDSSGTSTATGTGGPDDGVDDGVADTMTPGSTGNASVDGSTGDDTNDTDGTTGDPDTGSDEAGSSSEGVVRSVCGDDVVEGLEECDGRNLDGFACGDLGFTGGTLTCGRDCLFEISECFNSACGNDIVEGDEPCDGEDLGVGDCLGEGFDGGAIACAADCTYDTSGCLTFVCGNNILEGPETCDSAQLGGQDCLDLGFDTGTLGCQADCADYDTSGCVDYAGDCCSSNGDPGCDDNACWTIICAGDPFCCDNSWDGACANAAVAQCQTCAMCGDDLVNVDEVCDGASLDGETCGSQGFGGGDLSCAGDCGSFDTSACYDGDCCSDNGTPGCNDEECTDAVCAADAFCCDNNWDNICGNLGADTCAICGVECGDGSVDGAEDCDGGNLDGGTCVNQGFSGGGNLSCNNCSYDTSGCVAGPSYSSDIQPIWNANCGCHGNGGTSPTFANVTANTSYNNLVNVSAGQSALDLIEPNSTGGSYLYHKITNTQAVGVSMPFGGPLMNGATIGLIADWINDGAPNN